MVWSLSNFHSFTRSNNLGRRTVGSNTDNGERKENGLYAVVPAISGPNYGVSREGIEVNHSLIAPTQHRTAVGNVMRI